MATYAHDTAKKQESNYSKDGRYIMELFYSSLSSLDMFVGNEAIGVNIFFIGGKGFTRSFLPLIA